MHALHRHVLYMPVSAWLVGMLTGQNSNCAALTATQSGHSTVHNPCEEQSSHDQDLWDDIGIRVP